LASLGQRVTTINQYGTHWSINKQTTNDSTKYDKNNSMNLDSMNMKLNIKRNIKSDNHIISNYLGRSDRLKKKTNESTTNYG